jgi:diaminopimelate epimerase
VDFVKVQGLGNDFIVFDGPYTPRSDDIVRWCDRRTGIGADGVLVIERVAPDRVSMRYWNADGGEAEMCGNGLRCIALLAYQRGWVDDSSFVVDTAVGEHAVTVGEDSVRAFVGVPQVHRTGTLSINGTEVHPMAVGNPHAVTFVDDIETARVEEIGPLVENDPLFPDRTNVEFVQVLEDGSISARIWERGVGETQASGTGATASAFIAHTLQGVAQPVAVHLRGGTLTISFEADGAWMDGPAAIVFSGSVN